MAHPMSILIVDHEQPSRIAVETMLDCIGLTCRSVSSAQESLDCLASHPTDIVLTNLVMPIMSGLALLDAVVTKYPDTTFILMSSQGTISRAVQAIKRGAYDFIEKPIDPNELTALVQRAAQYRAIRAQSRVLTEVTQQWEATFDAVPDLVAILDADQRFVRINRAMANILGCQPYDVVGRPWQEWQEVAPVSAIFSSTDDAGEMREIAVPTLKMCLLTSRSPLSDVNGHSIGTVYVARDITRQKIAEDALRDSEQRLRSIYEGSNDAIMLLTEDGFLTATCAPSTCWA